MTRTITVRGREYTVEDEPRLDGEIAPHLYDDRGECVGVLVEVYGTTHVVGAPMSWEASDHAEAVRQILT